MIRILIQKAISVASSLHKRRSLVSDKSEFRKKIHRFCRRRLRKYHIRRQLVLLREKLPFDVSPRQFTPRITHPTRNRENVLPVQVTLRQPEAGMYFIHVFALQGWLHITLVTDLWCSNSTFSAFQSYNSLIVFYALFIEKSNFRWGLLPFLSRAPQKFTLNQKCCCEVFWETESASSCGKSLTVISENVGMEKDGNCWTRVGELLRWGNLFNFLSGPKKDEHQQPHAIFLNSFVLSASWFLSPA